MSSDSEALSVPAVPPATAYTDAPSAHVTTSKNATTQHVTTSRNATTQHVTPHRVVSIATNLPGPLAARRFAELGMHVTKVEPPSGDLMQHYCRAYYGELIAGQHVCAIDLKSEDGAAELRDLLAQADLLLTSHRPAALERLGLGWEQLHAEFPQLNQVAIVGHSGDDAAMAGHDLTYQAHAGTLDPPHMPRIPVADMAGSERAVSEGLAALLNRTHTGSGSYREVALADMAEHFGGPARHGLTSNDGLLGGGIPQYGLYPAREGWVAVALLEPHFLADGLELLGISGDREEFQRILATKTAAEWEAFARRHNLPLAAVREGPHAPDPGEG